MKKWHENSIYLNINSFMNVLTERPHRSMGRSSSNWPFRSQSIDRNLVRRSVQVLMSESNTSLNTVDDQVRSRKIYGHKNQDFFRDFWPLTLQVASHKALRNREKISLLLNIYVISGRANKANSEK